MSEPIVTVHWGDQEYFRYCLRAALHHGPVVAITPKALDVGEQWVPLEPLAQAVASDLNTMDMPGMAEWRLKFERMCFNRWPILREWMRRSGTESVLHIDSDVLMFHDPRKVWNEPECSTTDWAISMYAWSTCRLSKDTLDMVCDRFLHEHRTTDGTWPPNDMVAYDVIAKAKKVTDWSVPRGGWAVDHNIHCTLGWEPDPVTKDKSLTWTPEGPVGRLVPGESVRLCTLHLWADRKERAAEYYHKVYA